MGTKQVDVDVEVTRTITVAVEVEDAHAAMHKAEQTVKEGVDDYDHVEAKQIVEVRENAEVVE